jgi:hypothetical protein
MGRFDAALTDDATKIGDSPEGSNAYGMRAPPFTSIISPVI